MRQPLEKVLIPVLKEDIKGLIAHVEDLIKSEVNIKSIEYIDDTSDLLVKSIKPNFALLGKRFGPKMKAVSQIIQQWGKEEISQIESEGQANITIDGETVLLQLEEVLIQSQDIPGWSVATDNGITVALDVTLTTALKEEGVARDFVNRVQNLRKDMGLEVQDKIRIQIVPLNERVDNALLNFSEYIKTETQALALTLDGESNNATVLDMDEFELAIKIEKV
ncbi:Isoleucyl-tRNA synthetase [Cyclobacterium qasimii M12-11B]|uniref:Isoleucyl-tRNA synthetase n=1 Tax=Cyclobacterium qasimii M12-11B TaxID=641524 RepID=S7WIG4_9BACT|nr:Isoleucyl-tRNA synthetase [Cyclobacterium qasimii M12-11B]